MNFIATLANTNPDDGRELEVFIEDAANHLEASARASDIARDSHFGYVTSVRSVSDDVISKIREGCWKEASNPPSGVGTMHVVVLGYYDRSTREWRDERSCTAINAISYRKIS